MKYRSTRENKEEISAAEAIKKGLCDDGGLYMPTVFPEISGQMWEKLIGADYPERAATILSLYLPEYGYDRLLSDARAAYSDKFDGEIAPVKKLDEHLYVLELWHGPTSAFKDMALQIMPRLLSGALSITGEQKKALILVATSGDTGKAALEGFRDVPQTAISVFYPDRGVSETQKRQMQTQEGSNVNVTAIDGNFDDAQTGVKKLFADTEYRSELEEKGIFLSSANSINWGRLVPQVVYYVSAYCDMVANGRIGFGDRLDICVPTGNFGNILAAYIAKKMGLPIGKLICASNDNNVLTDFLTTGTYDRNRPFHTTVSPSMDILISSNLERLICLTAGHERCSEYMRELNTNGRYTVDGSVLEAINSDFVGKWCDEADCLAEIASVFERYAYLSDTHTAVAFKAAEMYAEERTDKDRPILVVSTASPYKFAPAVCRALGLESTGEDSELFMRLSDYTETAIPAPLWSVISKDIRFHSLVKADEMKSAVNSFIDSLV